MGRPAKHELDEVLRRATRLFWAHGSDAVSTRDLEEALDLRAPAIYRRFRSKNELLARCVDHYVDTVIVTRVRRFLEDADDPLQGLHDFFTSTLQPYGRKPRLRGCLLANTAAHADGQVPEVRDAIFRGWRLIDSAFQQQIERAQRVGQVDPDLDPEALSQALVMSLEGLLTLVRAGDTDLRPGIDMTFRLLARGRENG
jgi:TetR/AcrR family transcriptional repressor of nem operon